MTCQGFNRRGERCRFAALPGEDFCSHHAEPPLTNRQRAYLGAFEEWLLRPSEISLARRRRALGALCAEAGLHAGERRTTRYALRGLN